MGELFFWGSIGLAISGGVSGWQPLVRKSATAVRVRIFRVFEVIIANLSFLRMERGFGYRGNVSYILQVIG